MGTFQYYEPVSVEEARNLALSLGNDTTFVAGGTDVIVRINKRRVNYGHIINLKKIKELCFIREQADALRIGASTKLAEILSSKVVKEKLPAFYDGVESIGTPQIRNLGTLGGNICNASPCADSVPPLICLDAKAVVATASGDKEMPLQAFLTGPGKTVLQKGELLKEIIIPYPNADTRHHFYKHGPRKTADISVVNLGVSLEISKGVCRSARIALGSVAPTVIRSAKAESMLEGNSIDKIDIIKTGQAASEEAKPISDVRASLEYRTEIVAVAVERALRALLV